MEPGDEDIKYMPSIKQLSKRLIAKATGNAPSQVAIQKSIKFFLYLSGTGGGSNVNNSGEAAVLKYLLQKSDPEKLLCIFDVGANKGQFLGLVTENLRQQPHVTHCFEPGLTTFNILTGAVAKKTPVILNNFALSKARGKSTLYYDKAGSGLASLTKRDLSHVNKPFESSEDVLVETLDAYCEKNNIAFIDLLKIDVEGHELDVLSGANDMLRHGKIGLITFEFGGCNIDTRTFIKDFFMLFDSLDMQLNKITPSGYIYPIENYTEIQEQFSTANYLVTTKQ